ncbi:diguanylate cyclase [Polynucleobacter sp. MWH-UH25E]|uniref:GGDEF domain-containing protein n=1 Tax=Polynucleobacter sp. MWH-UH25E TaxID=1855616 RepID=UPI001BFE3F60|nr:diguanylate cyclase [Polynucleobacter sp. MWH-UH25E]QWD61867.1 GGDEF domain-containing protein [Polynucleobacter sp. MWH-UH25E]
MNIGTITIYLVAILIQGIAIFFALIVSKKAPQSYRWGWVFLSMGFLIILARRINPLLETFQTGHQNLFDAILSFIISSFLLIGSIGIHRFISRIRSDNDLLCGLSELDPLTHAYSRSEILYRLSNEIQRHLRTSRPLAILEIDIDRFKLVNDQYGHAIGDEILQFLTQQIQLQLRTNDHLGRIGGEEFIVVLPETNEKSALIIAERIRTHIEMQTYFTRVESTPIQITISIGLSATTTENNGKTAGQINVDLVKQADQAMYNAKNTGRNKSSCWSEINQNGMINSSIR